MYVLRTRILVAHIDSSDSLSGVRYFLRYSVRGNTTIHWVGLGPELGSRLESGCSPGLLHAKERERESLDVASSSVTLLRAPCSYYCILYSITNCRLIWFNNKYSTRHTPTYQYIGSVLFEITTHSLWWDDDWDS